MTMKTLLNKFGGINMFHEKDKLISVRVNSKQYEQVNAINKNAKYSWQRISFGSWLEQQMEEFIKNNKNKIIK